MRGATIKTDNLYVDAAFQPTRPLRGATYVPLIALDMTFISTHAPLAGRDVGYLTREQTHDEFQPTRPLRGATAASSGRRR